MNLNIKKDTGYRLIYTLPDAIPTIVKISLIRANIEDGIYEYATNGETHRTSYKYKDVCDSPSEVLRNYIQFKNDLIKRYDDDIARLIENANSFTLK